jgi:hypothetical protein
LKPALLAQMHPDKAKRIDHQADQPVLRPKMAEWTGLEPATPGVTGRYSNQLNYHSWQLALGEKGNN